MWLVSERPDRTLAGPALAADDPGGRRRHVHEKGGIDGSERFLRQVDVAGAVLNEEDIMDGITFSGTSTVVFGFSQKVSQGPCLSTQGQLCLFAGSLRLHEAARFLDASFNALQILFECRRKNRIISRLASGPRGSVYEPLELPPDHAWPAPCRTHCSSIDRPLSSL
jgi:hypothetical protein